MNYNSEQAMAEMVEAIGVSVEDQFPREVQASLYYSIIIDEATDISVAKQLGLCIQYLGEGGETCEISEAYGAIQGHGRCHY